jgi:D-serine dehydratase
LDFFDLQTSEDLILDASIRGVPPGAVLKDRAVATMNWSPRDGTMPLPVLTLDQAVLQSNARHVLRFAQEEGVLLAPHSKTPMMPGFTASLVKEGAWGATVANVQQLSALLTAGVTRIIYGSPPGGTTGTRHLAAALSFNPDTDVFVFLDSVQSVKALHAALSTTGGARAKGLVEVGFGRTGARDLPTAVAIRDAILDAGGLIELAGVATYEAAAVKQDLDYRQTFSELFALVTATFQAVREVVPPLQPLIVTAGGSTYFDDVIEALRPLARANNSTLVLRSGAIFFSDDGLYKRAFEAMAARERTDRTRRLAELIRPALSLWAEVISRPEQGLAIAGFGMRDAPADQGLPVIRRVFRDGVETSIGGQPLPVIEKLNDQHAFIRGPGTDGLLIGDVLELGISHPCTALQRWRVVYGTDELQVVRKVFRTHFG